MARRKPLTITRRNGRRQQSLKTTTLREFGGGWNVIDNDLNLDSRFSRILTNMTLLQDGSLGIRQGTRLVTDLRIHDAAEAMLLVDAEDEQIVTADGERKLIERKERVKFVRIIPNPDRPCPILVVEHV